MNLKIAIQHDEITHRNGEHQSYSDRWLELAERFGVRAVPVDVFSADVVETISSCDAFMWRPSPLASDRLYAMRLLYAVEKGLGIPVFPDLNSSWHFEDKVGQYYFFAAAGIPIPATRVYWSRQQAEQFCDTATYPFVLKLATGYQASNVRLVRNRDDAQYYIEKMFGPGAVSLAYGPASPFRLLLRRLRAASETLRGRNPNGSTAQVELQHGYFFVQEFLPGNDFDVRVTITGDRAFVFRRFNRPNDFRASGSGLFDWNPDAVGEDAVRLGYRVARRLGSQTLTVDILRRGGEPVIIELGVAYASWCVRDCPGHWALHGSPDSGSLEWKEGSMEPADAIFADFVASLPQPSSTSALTG
jgi:glutathione synthase/RimK-type ligase-like ATP-grasp enzyme